MKAVVAIIAVSLICASQAFAADFSKPSPKLLEEGKKVYDVQCFSCHGAQGAGDGPAAIAFNPPPRDFTAGVWTNGGAPSQVFKTITEGLPGTSMAPFGQLKVRERWALAHYIRTFDPKAPDETAATLAASGVDVTGGDEGPKPEIPVRFAIERLVKEAQ